MTDRIETFYLEYTIRVITAVFLVGMSCGKVPQMMVVLLWLSYWDGR